MNKINVFKDKCIVIMAGGTGGHVFPGLEVARALKNHGAEVKWLGANGIETKLVPENSIELFSLTIKGLRGNGIKGYLTLPFKLLRAVYEAYEFLKKNRVKLVVGFGGFASGPGALAAKLLGIPLVIHEQNAHPGLTNKLLAPLSKAVLTGFPLEHLKKSLYVGNPVRKALRNIAPPNLRFAKKKHTALNILIVGGSQGSRFFNQYLPKVLQKSTKEISVWHQTGVKLFQDAEKEWNNSEKLFKLTPFIDDMEKAYDFADIIICRSGALTVAELSAVGLGSILIPFPYAVDDHQTKNAEFLVKNNAAYLISENMIDEVKLLSLIEDLSREKCLELAINAKSLEIVDTTEKIVEQLGEYIE